VDVIKPREELQLFCRCCAGDLPACAPYWRHKRIIRFIGSLFVEITVFWLGVRTDVSEQPAVPILDLINRSIGFFKDVS
jgi:hypothetical protein